MPRFSTNKDFNLINRAREQGLPVGIWLSLSLPIIFIDHVGRESRLIPLPPRFHGSKGPTQRSVQVLPFP